MKPLPKIVSRLIFLALCAIAGPLQAATTIVRNPYLQQGGSTGMVVCWRTSAATTSFVRYGTEAGHLNFTASNGVVITTNHAVALNGLQPDTKYFYQVGSATNWFATSTSNYFITAPPVGTPGPTRIWVLGDSGYSNSTSVAVRNAYTTFTGARPTDVWLMLGDNAYGDGTEAEYQTAVFNMYPTILRNTVLWPTIGNHDAHEEDDLGFIPYFDIFTLPTQAEAGGVPSGTERYYSFDRANIHFVCLDSMTSSRSTTSSMSQWLRADLAATAQEWIIAFWHHPPYSKGTHNSDSEFELVEMRQNIVPILESYGVDLVLCGHSHNYERSYLINGHYGLSSTFTASMKIDGGNGRTNGTGAYQKPGGNAGNEGTVYSVAGCAAQASTPSAHPALLVRSGVAGSVVIDVTSNRLDYAFLTRYGTNADTFTILKPVPPPSNPPAAPTNLLAVAVDDTTINLSWNSGSSDTAGFRLERSTNGADFALLSLVSAGVTNGADTGLAPSTTCHYRILATNSAGPSAWSDIAQATTFAPPPDTNAPAAVANLFISRVTSNSVTLLWTAPGDDGNSGTATDYDVRYSTEFITEAGWDTATPATGEPAPAGAGNLQLFTITGLDSATNYFFALKTSDEANNLSPLSNIPSAFTPPAGTPAPPTNLIATAVATNEIELRWIDDSDNEDGFKVERSTNGVDFLEAGLVGAGVTNVADTSVLPATTYHYRVSAFNAVASSPASGIAQATTPPIIPPDNIPPAAVTNLRVTAIATNRITLAWTAPGDDGALGTAAAYELRLSGALITGSNWPAATLLTGLPAPLPAGSTQSIAILNLGAGTTYAFALKSADELGNLSPLSNVPLATTPGVPPPWISRDLGSVGLAGRANHTNGLFNVQGAGKDIGSDEDSFHFVWQPAVGNCEIIARVTTISNTSSSAKAGVMIRENTTLDARLAMLALTPGKKILWLRRDKIGDDIDTTTASGSNWVPPVWLRVTRTNNSFAAWHSTNGTTWISSSAKTITMGTNSLIGLGVTSKTTSKLNRSVFDPVIAKP